MTLTNLDGFKKEIKFSSSYSSEFFTYDHRDIAMFRFDESISNPVDGSIKVNFKDKINTDLLINAGIATGAFPVGLAYRTFSRDKKYIEENILVTEMNNGIEIELDKNAVSHNDQYTSTFIDGGTIDNEPFDLTKYLLEHQVNKYSRFISADIKDHKSNKMPRDFNSTVLMIDPFPSEERERLVIKKNESPFSILGAIGKLFSTVRTQSMLKAKEVKKAILKSNYSCYLISPRRKTGEKVIDGSKAIACGCLEGFGGFLDKEFREHDFYLGRINCKSFLQKHFVISETDALNNHIFSDYHHQLIRDRFVHTDKDNISYLPIIPDVNIFNDEVTANCECSRKSYFDSLYRKLTFPHYSVEKFRTKFSKYEAGIKKRLKMIIQSNIKDFSTTSFYIGFGLLFGGSKIVEAIQDYVESELKRWEIIKPR